MPTTNRTAKTLRGEARPRYHTEHGTTYNMRNALLVAMLSLLILRRPAACAFIQTISQTSRTIRLSNSFSLHRSAAINVCSTQCSPTQQLGGYLAATSLRLLPSRFCSTDNEKQNNQIVQSSHGDDMDYLQPDFKKGDLVMVEVIYFGPLGASVDIVAHNSHNPSDCIPQDEPALGRGMILQREINYFRRGRGGVDVVKYEILPAYVEHIREEVVEGEVQERLDISLRPVGGKAKAQELGEQILEKLKESGGVLDVGDKSSPEEINEVFPGSSKGAFKKAVSGLFRRGLVRPGPNSISLM